MMIEMNKKLQKIMDNTDDCEKIRLFYEMARYFCYNVGDEIEDPDMENLIEDIANVVNDIENL